MKEMDNLRGVNFQNDAQTNFFMKRVALIQYGAHETNGFKLIGAEINVVLKVNSSKKKKILIQTEH